MKTMKTKKMSSTFIASLLAVPLSLAITTDASALVVGFDPTGTATYTNFADNWADKTDTGLDIGTIPLPSTVGDEHTFITQLRVDSMNNGGFDTSPISLNQNDPGAGAFFDNRFEITKELKIKDILTEFLDNDNDPSTFPNTANFTAGSMLGGTPELTIYFDPYADGSESKPNNVTCYGSGACAADDGIKILELHLKEGTSSFTATSLTTGTGSFDLTFVASFVDSNYLDIDINNFEAGIGITGTLNIPTFYNPTEMWDGSQTADGIAFKVDSSELFFSEPNQVPEPGTLVMLGLGLFGIGAMRKKKSV